MKNVILLIFVLCIINGLLLSKVENYALDAQIIVTDGSYCLFDYFFNPPRHAGCDWP